MLKLRSVFEADAFALSGKLVSKNLGVFIVLGNEMVKDKAYYDSLTELIIGCAYKVSNNLGCGFLEKVYEKALAIELSEAGLGYETQKQILVRYKGAIVGEYFADVLVENDVILELKAVKSIE